ncbi:hypothetical protein [Luteolibacter marinus]|uniref:hypothetical protein n=1 Tax=Luteolibacter marinus TaxID=2776705 RepID=UPI0018686371|nr:hypothetical protein [Luteolibacter marinus]
MGFTDLLSSSRGPGVIGTLLALLVLVGFGTLYFFVFDKGMQGGDMTIEGMIRQQDQAIDTLKIQIENSNTRLEEAKVAKVIGKEADELKNRADIDEARISELLSTKSEAEAAIVAATEDWEKYKEQYRQSEWAKAQGEELGEVRTVSGEVYTKVAITGVDHTGMKVSYSGGLKTIPPKELPADLYDRFQFSEEKTAKVKKKMDDDFGDLSNNVEIARLAKKGTEKLKTVQDLKEENLRLGNEINHSKIDLPRKQAAVDRFRMAYVNEKNKKGGVSKAPQMQVQLRTMERALSDARRAIPDKQRQLGDNKRKIESLSREVDEIKDEIAQIKKDLASKNQGAPQP